MVQVIDQYSRRMNLAIALNLGLIPDAELVKRNIGNFLPEIDGIIESASQEDIETLYNECRDNFLFIKEELEEIRKKRVIKVKMDRIRRKIRGVKIRLN